MTALETKEIIQKIKIFRPFFQTGNSKSEERKFIEEWDKVLKDYSYEDVDKKVDEYFKDGNNIGKVPDPYYLVKYLNTETEKKSSDGLVVRCPICQKEMQACDFENHYGRCLSVSYICKRSKMYFGQTPDTEKLYAMEQREFNRKYLEFLKKLYEKPIPEWEKMNLEKAFEKWRDE